MNGTHPRTKADLQQALGTLSAGGLKFWLEMEPTRFASPFGEAWSPADNVRHLIKSTVPVTRALKLPGLVLRVLFGPGGGTSATYADLVERYDAVLAAGGKAGRFAPSPLRPPADLSSWQVRLVADCQAAVDALAGALGSWSETDLDRRRLPHPLLGKLTVREMLFFTLIHYDHHRALVARRLGALAKQAT